MSWPRLVAGIVIVIAVLAAGYILLAPKPAGMPEKAGQPAPGRAAPPPSIDEYGSPRQ